MEPIDKPEPQTAIRRDEQLPPTSLQKSARAKSVTSSQDEVGSCCSHRLHLYLALRQKSCRLRMPGSFWRISLCHPRSCLPNPSCGPIALRKPLSVKVWRLRKI